MLLTLPVEQLGSCFPASPHVFLLGLSSGDLVPPGTWPGERAQSKRLSARISDLCERDILALMKTTAVTPLKPPEHFPNLALNQNHRTEDRVAGVEIQAVGELCWNIGASQIQDGRHSKPTFKHTPIKIKFSSKDSCGV